MSLGDYTRHTMAQVTANVIFISTIKTNDILYVSTKQLASKGKMVSLHRTLLAPDESRESALQFFRSVYEEAFELIRYCNQLDETKVYSVNLLKHIEESKTGLFNHSQTYAGDSFHTAKIKTLVEMIDTESQILKDGFNVEVLTVPTSTRQATVDDDAYS